MTYLCNSYAFLVFTPALQNHSHNFHCLFLFSSELVLKVRIQNPNARENDFIEVELDRQELTYRSLLRVCCRELDISAEHVEKIRKLPNTMLRKVPTIGLKSH